MGVAPDAGGGAADSRTDLFKAMSEHCSQYTNGELASEIAAFIAGCRKPVLIEPGCEPMALAKDCHAVSAPAAGAGAVVEAWSEKRNYSRKVIAVESKSRWRLALTAERFGKKTGTVLILDESAPRGSETEKRLARLTFRERFRRALRRRFPGWEIETSMEADLEHSLSPAYPRGFIRRGSSAWAAIGGEQGAGGLLTFGLIWLSYLRNRERKVAVEGLILMVPAGEERNTCLRLRWMDPRAARFSVLAFTPDGYEDEVDLRDDGNLETRVNPWREHPAWSPEVEGLVAELRRNPDVEAAMQGDGALSLRVRGLEFARAHPDRLVWGLETKRLARASNVRELARLAEELALVRHPSGDGRHLLFRRAPEAWLESQVRANLRELDARFPALPFTVRFRSLRPATGMWSIFWRRKRTAGCR